MEPWIAGLASALVDKQRQEQELKKQTIENLLALMKAGFNPYQPQGGLQQPPPPMPLTNRPQLPEPGIQKPVQGIGGMGLQPQLMRGQLPTVVQKPIPADVFQVPRGYEGGFGGQEYWKKEADPLKIRSLELKEKAMQLTAANRARALALAKTAGGLKLFQNILSTYNNSIDTLGMSPDEKIDAALQTMIEQSSLLGTVSGGGIPTEKGGKKKKGDPLGIR